MSKLTKYLLLLGVAIIWGSTFIIVKDTVDTYSPFSLVALRFTIAIIPLSIMIFVKKLKVFYLWPLGLLGGITQFLAFTPQAIGMQYTTPSNSAFITGLFVLFTPLLNILFYKKLPSKKEFIASIIAIIGLWILTGGIQNFNIGDFVTLITAFSISLNLILTKIALEKGANSTVLTFQQLLVTAIIAYICVFLMGTKLLPSDTSMYIFIVYLGIMATFVAYFVQNSVMKSLDSNLVSIIVATEPFFALLFSWGFKFELFSIFKLVGGLIMLFAIILPELKIRMLERGS